MLTPTDSAGTYVAFDLETTGLRPAANRIVEIGAVRFDAAGDILATFERLVNPHQPSTPEARAIHRISDESLAAAEPASVILPLFVSFLDDPRTTTVLAHHSASDAGFLGAELLRANLPLPKHPVIDTLAWARRRWPEFGNHRLDSLAQRFGTNDNPAHRALADSLRVRQVFLALQAGEPQDFRPPLAYPIHDGTGPPPVPCGWCAVAEAIGHAGVVWIEYSGGTRGSEPRAVTPQRFTQRGGIAYLVAVCHLDLKVKEFQIDRVRNFQVIPATA